MKNIFSNKYNFKFFESFSKQANKNFINFSNTYFYLNIKNLINTSRLNNFFEISKLVLGINKTLGMKSDIVSNPELESLRTILNKLSDISIVSKSKNSFKNF